MEALREIEAKGLKADEIECYVGDELVNVVPKEMAVKAILRGEARLLNPRAIQAVTTDPDELQRIALEEKRKALCAANQEYRRKHGLF